MSTQRWAARKHRWAAIAAGLLLLVALLGVAPRGTVHAAAQASQQWFGVTGNYLGNASGGGNYSDHIKNLEASTKCLDVPGGAFYSNHGLYDTENDASGTQVQLWDCEPGDVQHDYARNQIWQQWDNGDGTWTFCVSGQYDYCLDSQDSQYAGAPVVVNYYTVGFADVPDMGKSEQWTIGPNGELQSVGSPGYCMDIDQATFQGDGNGAQVVLEPCDTQGNPPPAAPAPAPAGSQNWFTVSGSNCTSLPGNCVGHFHNEAAQTKCLDIPGYRFYSVDVLAAYFQFLDASGAPLQLWDCQPNDAQHGYDDNQLWYQQNNGDGTWTYYATGAQNFCMDSQGLQSPGAPVVVNPCDGQDSQKWTYDSSGTQLQSVGSPYYCADINPASFQGDGNGAQVVLEPCLGVNLYPSY
jgi:hypothetical protein